MTLLEATRDLDSLDKEGTIYAAVPWTASSQVIISPEPETGGLPAEAHPLVGPEGRELADRALPEGHQRLDLVRGVVLAQRVPDELGVHQDAPEIRVAPEGDAHHVERLALEPVGAPPHGDEGVDLGVYVGAVVVADARLDADAVGVLERAQVAGLDAVIEMVAAGM